MLAVVGDQVAQSKTIVTGNEVDAVIRRPPAALVEVGAAAQASGQGGDQPVFAAQEAADVIAEMTVPFRPAPPGREAPHLVEPGGVPGLGDQLGVGQDRIVGDAFDQRGIGQHRSVASPPQDGGEIETEAVDVHLGDPIMQTLQDQISHVGMVTVNGVAAAGIVVIHPGHRIDDVINRIVQPSEGISRAALIPFAGVVEDDIQNHLDAGFVQGFDHLLELPHRIAVAVAAGVGGLGCKETDGVVPPEIEQRGTGIGMEAVAVHLVKFVDRQQFYCRHAQLFQVGNLLDHSPVGAGVGHSGGGIDGKAAHVHLVDHRIVQRQVQRLIVFPVKRIVYHDGAAMIAGRRGAVLSIAPVKLSPLRRAGIRLGVGVQQHDLRLVAVHQRLQVGLTVDPVAVADLPGDALNEHMPDVAGLIETGIEGQFQHRFILHRKIDHQRHRSGVFGEECKIDSVLPDFAAKRPRRSAHDLKIAADDGVEFFLLWRAFPHYRSVPSV